ncbi:MAG TPA: N-6 DNA methylase [Polyangiaceae bacterium LLY-WYZ-15_(1-7)]|nr:restriction endonuclease subunit M [Myxococcales bacterium]MAT24852.1 restriction endonuclease subunit M [Sandaracinus sp.]HJK93342.1 N-6 DNA methylase [Polyangiaceae bacterium LLY-WYZ-15_(1-7)]MBJ74206.1 restriction endonuclease subunit M [Sandaracinus sp.]HJL02367.1 N-6 DNA methylase [Polyangiaceae bacterium LLY-WYZ-15_(1-7)]
MSEQLEIEEIDQAGADEVTSLEEGKILDYITGDPIKDSPKEQVRQRIARALFHEYGISVEDMARDFKMKVDGRRKKVDIAIFDAGEEHTVGNLRRVVICDKEPKKGSKGAYKMRDHIQAKKEFGLLHGAMTEAAGCRYGLWTNGLEFFFFDKEVTRFDVKFKPIGDWPMGDESIGTRDVVSQARLRRADPDMLRTAFRRCHNFIHGNEGMPKDAAFWQFLYLIFAKMHDEKRSRDEQPCFWAGPTEQFDEAGRKAIRERVIPLFDEVKREYSTIFRGNEEITLSDRALAFMVSELAKYDFGRTDVDAKGAAYQEIVGTNLRGDRGQYFTPRGAIKLMVEMLAPKPSERVLDPACGTGGFLVAALDYMNRLFHAEAEVDVGAESTDEFLSIRDRLAAWSKANLFGADFDPFLVRAAQMNVVMASDAEGHLFNMNSLEFPAGHLTGVDEANGVADLGTMDVVMTNPPFGTGIPVTDPNILRSFELARVWESTDDGAYLDTGRMQASVAPEVLFVERCVQWLKPGGRAGIVLPNGILGNPGDEYIRWWVLRHCWVLASVDLPVEVFIVEANVNILTSLLFIKRKTQQEIQAEDLGAATKYPVFMAVAENVGFDRRGNTLYKRHPTGEEMVEEVEVREKIRVNGSHVVRVLRRREKVIDDDLPLIAEAYREFRNETPEPGA